MPERGVVLLVDDDPDDRFLFEQAWRVAGIAHPIRAVEDGARALAYLAGAGAYADRAAHPPPALLLLDIKMPGLSGFDVLARLRRDEALRALPVIVLSASTSPGDVAEAYRLGANAFFVKPSSVQELVELLKAVNACWLRFTEFPQTEAEGKNLG